MAGTVGLTTSRVRRADFRVSSIEDGTTTFHALGTPLLLGNVVIANQKGTGPGSGNTNIYPLVDK